MKYFAKGILLTFCTLFYSTSLIYSTTNSVKTEGRSSGQSDIKKNSYWIQVKASESKDTIGRSADSLNMLSIPTQVSTTEKDGKTFYRLRIGPFNDSVHTAQFGSFLNLEKPWIVKTPYDANVILVKNILLDTINILNKKVEIVTNNSCNSISLYVHNFGTELSVLPSDAYVYINSNNSLAKVVLKDITGIFPTDTAIIYGKADKLFFNPDGKTDDSFKSEINSYAKSNNITYSQVKDSIIYFNDGQDAYFVRLGMFSFSTRKSILYNKHGFDYVDSDTKKVAYKGSLDNKVLGSFFVKPANKESLISYSCKKVNLFLKSTTGENFDVFILVKDK